MLSKLEDMLGRYMGAYPAFRIKPIGQEGSPARIEQEALMGLEEEANALLKDVKNWRETRNADFGFALADMSVGQRITDNGKERFGGFDWIITRVPGGWIYTAQTAMSPCSVFVPFNDEVVIPF